MQQTEREPSFIQFFHLLFKHWKLIVALFLGAVLTVLAYSMYMPASYESEAKIYVRFGRENIPQNPTGKITAPLSTMAMWEQIIKSEIEIIRNQYLAQEVVKDLGPDFDAFPPGPPPETLWQKTKALFKNMFKWVMGHVMDWIYKLGLLESLPPFESAVKRIMSGLEVTMVPDSSVLDVSYRSRNPWAAKRVLDLMIQLYLSHRMDVYRNAGTFAFFDEQVKDRQAQLAGVEDDLARFKQDLSITDIDQQRDLLLRTLDETKHKHWLFELDLIKARAEFAESSPEVRLQKEIVRGADHEIGRLQADIDRLDRAEKGLHRLERDYKVTEKNYFLYQEQREDSKIIETMDLAKISNVAVIQPASTPIMAVRTFPMLPNKTFRLIIATVLGLSLGFGLALIAEYFSPTIKSPQDLEANLSIPVWGVIPDKRTYRW